jgi:hypothetical protein
LRRFLRQELKAGSLTGLQGTIRDLPRGRTCSAA